MSMRHVDLVCSTVKVRAGVAGAYKWGLIDEDAYSANTILEMAGDDGAIVMKAVVEAAKASAVPLLKSRPASPAPRPRTPSRLNVNHSTDGTTPSSCKPKTTGNAGPTTPGQARALFSPSQNPGQARTLFSPSQNSKAKAKAGRAKPVFSPKPKLLRERRVPNASIPIPAPASKPVPAPTEAGNKENGQPQVTVKTVELPPSPIAPAVETQGFSAEADADKAGADIKPASRVDIEGSRAEAEAVPAPAHDAATSATPPPPPVSATNEKKVVESSGYGMNTPTRGCSPSPASRGSSKPAGRVRTPPRTRASPATVSKPEPSPYAYSKPSTPIKPRTPLATPKYTVEQKKTEVNQEESWPTAAASTHTQNT